MLRPALVVACLFVGHSAVAAQPMPAAHVDEISVFGGVDPDAARRFVARVLSDAGYAVLFSLDDDEGCGPDLDCLRGRGRDRGAAVALRATVLDLAGEVSVVLLGVEVFGQGSFKHGARAVDLRESEPALVVALARPAAPVRSRGRRIAAWTISGAGLVLAVAGGLAILDAREQRAAFFAAHVDADGFIVGISPEEARRAEDRAQRWALAGAVLLGGAGAAGLTATILFAGGGDESPVRPAGIMLSGEF